MDKPEETIEESVDSLNGLTIASVPSNLIDLVWDQMVPILDMCIRKAPDDLVASVVYEQLKTNNSMLLMVYRGPKVIAINVLDIKVLDSGVRVLYIPIIAGSEMDVWLEEAHRICVQIAKDYNCTELRGIAVRKGWMSKLQPYGWEEMFTTVRCPLKDIPSSGE